MAAGADKIRKEPKQPMIERVMPLLLQLEKAGSNDYVPAAVSFGPYHHGDPKLALVEAFKPKAVELFAKGGQKSKESYYKKVVSIIDDLRSNYEQETVDRYTDDDLAQMLLRDAALLIIYMEISATDPTKASDELKEKFKAMDRHLGMLTIGILSRDMALFDNQIPFRVIRVLVDARYGAGSCGVELARRFLINNLFGEHGNKEAWQQKVGKPLHLLHFIRMLHIPRICKPKVEEDKKSQCSSLEIESGCMDLENGLCLRKLLGCKSAAAAEKDSLKRSIPVFRAATDLKAKGIYFKPSPTQLVTDVTFKYHFLYARLRIPEFTVSTNTKVLYKNMIAFELSPNIPSMAEISSFINFIKSLIEKAEDVKELREKKILRNNLGSDQEVLDMLKDISTHGANLGRIYKNVRKEIEAHCDSKMKTWMAELLHTNFKSPWTMFAFLAAVVLLGVTVAQLYYAVYPN